MWEPDIDAYEPSLVAAKAACVRFVCDMEGNADPYWLTLQGTFGCGKTMLMRQVHREAKRINPGNPANCPIWPPDWQTNKDLEYNSRRPYAHLYDEGGLISRMRAGHYELPRELGGDWFVAVDEVGIVRDPTNFVAEAIATLCETRLRKWTMFATNLSLQEISERMDARIASRMLRDGNKFISITAGDYALRG